MQKLEVIGIANPILDILVKVDDSTFASLAIEKATMRLVDEAEQERLLAACGRFPFERVSGGSVANSIIACAQLGAATGLIGCLGDDANGCFYRNECESLGMKIAIPPISGAHSGICLSIITPDAERTMRTSLGASNRLSAENCDRSFISAAEWLFIEGYLLSNGELGQGAVLRALQYAKESGTKVAFTVSESWVVESFPKLVNEIVSQADFVFCNATEACSLTGKATEEEAFKALSTKIPGVAVTAGAKGAFVAREGIQGFVPAFARQAQDLTGAGDMFAGALLFGIVRDVPLLDAARKACFLAGEVISRIGARLRSETKGLWEQCP